VYVNLAAFSYFGANNAYEVDRQKLFKLDFSDFKEGSFYYKSANTNNKVFGLMQRSSALPLW